MSYVVFRIEENSMGRVKEIEIACIVWHSKTLKKGLDSVYIISIFEICWTEPPFMANLLFRYAQSGPERTSFSGSTMCVRDWKWQHHMKSSRRYEERMRKQSQVQSRMCKTTMSVTLYTGSKRCDRPLFAAQMAHAWAAGTQFLISVYLCSLFFE